MMHIRMPKNVTFLEMNRGLLKVILRILSLKTSSIFRILSVFM